VKNVALATVFGSNPWCHRIPDSTGGIVWEPDPIPLWPGISQTINVEAGEFLATFGLPRTTPVTGWRRTLTKLRRPETMIWETPTAIDLRFGLEITMYIANR
jgi:coenzyme PQQ precursor peptide PqqA